MEVETTALANYTCLVVSSPHIHISRYSTFAFTAALAIHTYLIRACANSVYRSLLREEGPGYEARSI